MEIQTLWQTENPDSRKMKNLSDEVSDLRSQLSKKQNEYLIQCRDKFGDQGWSCPGSDYDDDMMDHQSYGMGSRIWQREP